MAITASAKKALRASLRRRVFNLRRKKAILEVAKKVKRLVAEKKIAEARAALRDAYKAFDKAAKTHAIDKNAASRNKSRLARFVKKAEGK